MATSELVCERIVRKATMPCGVTSYGFDDQQTEKVTQEKILTCHLIVARTTPTSKRLNSILEARRAPVYCTIVDKILAAAVAKPIAE